MSPFFNIIMTLSPALNTLKTSDIHCGKCLSSPNVILDRARLLDNVWGEEGVIVGRSLDVFVSRLRKK